MKKGYGKPCTSKVKSATKVKGKSKSKKKMY